MSKEVRVKILDMEYDEEEQIFIMRVLHIEKREEIRLVMRAKDFGIFEEVPIDVINTFCEEMKNKEKNLFIETEQSKIDKDGTLSEEKILETDEDMNKYPLEEVVRKIYKEEYKDES